ncbi:MAG: hypothetical protein ACK5B9_01680 [Flavobacteriia bacterium]|jgi:hypothetical protein
MTLKYFSPIIVLLLLSCHTSKNTTQKDNTENNISANMRFIVSFISIGSGPDGEAKILLDNYLADYQTKNKVKLTIKTTKWGREGEIDYCFKLSELKDKEQSSFIKEVQDLLKNSTLVRYEENSPCK